MHNDKRAAVLIPVYKTNIDEKEKVALRRCVDILGSYPLIFIAPYCLDTAQFEETYGIKNVERFADDYFSGIPGYNRLMVSEEFYERFVEYEYILIYQTDAYVFSDRLIEWCDKGYDYVGAPWIPKEKYNKKFWRTELGINQFIYRLTGRVNARSHYFFTGNGGFSLRKVKTLLEVAKSDSKYIEKFMKRNPYRYAEDVYWCLFANRRRVRLRIPGYREALDFSFENFPEMLYGYNSNKLPFGTHAWFKGQPERLQFWRRFIELPEGE